jgi:hypothetical protein
MEITQSVETMLSEEDVEQIEEAERDSKRSKTKYGDKIEG